jgi:hypothetical protein
MTARPLEADDFPHRVLPCLFCWSPHHVRFRTFLQPFYDKWTGMRNGTADSAWFYSTDIESYWPFQLRLEAVPTWNNHVPISEQLTSAISAKPIRHHTAKAFIRSIHRSPAPAGARQCGKCHGPFPLAAAFLSSALRKPSGGAAHHFANKAGTRDIPGLSRASSTGRG